MPLHEALNSCNSLGESLWKSSAGYDSIENDLNYLVLQKRYDHGQRYWIAPVRGTPSTLDADGRVKKASANEHLPVLCTQTAPYSTPDQKDTNATWQVTVNSNNQHLTGYGSMMDRADSSTNRDLAFVIDSSFDFSAFDMPKHQSDGPTLRTSKVTGIMRLLSTTAPNVSRAQAVRKIVSSSTSGLLTCRIPKLTQVRS